MPDINTVPGGALGVSIVLGWLGDGARLGEDDGEGARLEEGPGGLLSDGLLSDGRPEPGGLPGRVTPGESRGPVSVYAPGEASTVGTGDGPVGAAGLGLPAR